MSRQIGARAWWQDERGARPLLHVALALLVTGLAVSPVYAGADSVSHSLPHGSRAIPIGLALTALAGLGLVGARRSGRKAALVSLALLVALLGLETAVHSVHHLDDPAGATACALLSASQHEPGASAATRDVAAPTWTTAPSLPVHAEPICSLRVFGPPEGRAPPALPSV